MKVGGKNEDATKDIKTEVKKIITSKTIKDNKKLANKTNLNATLKTELDTINEKNDLDTFIADHIFKYVSFVFGKNTTSTDHDGYTIHTIENGDYKIEITEFGLRSNLFSIFNQLTFINDSDGSEIFCDSLSNINTQAGFIQIMKGDVITVAFVPSKNEFIKFGISKKAPSYAEKPLDFSSLFKGGSRRKRKSARKHKSRKTRTRRTKSRRH